MSASERISPLVSGLLLHGGKLEIETNAARPRRTSTASDSSPLADSRLTALRGVARSTQPAGEASADSNTPSVSRPLPTWPTEILRSVKDHLSVEDQARLARTNRRLFEIAQPDLNAIPVGKRISSLDISNADELAATTAAIVNIVARGQQDFLLTVLAAHVVQGCERLENHGYQEMNAFLRGAGEQISIGSKTLQQIAGSMRRIVDAETHQPPEAHQSLSQHPNPDLRAKAITAIHEGRPEFAEVAKLMLNDPWDKALVQAAEILQSLKPATTVSDRDQLTGLTRGESEPFHGVAFIQVEEFLRTRAPLNWPHAIDRDDGLRPDQPSASEPADRSASSVLVSRFSDWMRRAFQ